MCGRGLDLATLRWDEARLSIIQPAGTVSLHFRHVPGADILVESRGMGERSVHVRRL